VNAVPAMMPTMMTAAALADLRVDGLPSTKRSINRLVKREGWSVLYDDGNRALIEVDRLPQTIRAAIAARFARRTLIQSETVRRARGRPCGTNFFTRNGDMADAITAWLATRFLGAARIYELLAAEFPTREQPHIRTLRRFVAQVEADKKVVLAQLRDPDRARAQYRLSLGRADGGVTYAHEIWELDTTPADVMCVEGRKRILGLIDRYSRRVRFIVADSESAQAVRRLLFRAISDWGVVPAMIIVDQGSGYVNETVKSACDLLGIDHHPCPPSSPELKPFVERLFGTFTRQRARILDGFVGHNVAEAQRLRAVARKETGKPEIVGTISADQLQDILDNWTVGTYEARIHSSIGMSPFDKAQTSPTAAAPAPAIDLLSMMLTAYVGDLTVGKLGLRWKRGSYYCKELIPHKGNVLHVRRDENELGELYAFDGDGSFIGTAINYERSGLSEREFAMLAREHEREYETAHRKHIRRLKKDFPFERARDQLLRDEATRAGKLIELPIRPTAAVRAVANEPRLQAADNRVSAPASATLYSHPIARVGDDVAARIARAEALISDAASGAPVDARRLDHARLFLGGSAVKAHRNIQKLIDDNQRNAS
jgi:putative transposase